MFIKKDLRKIHEILEDENDERHDMKLSKRLVMIAKVLMIAADVVMCVLDVIYHKVTNHKISDV